MVIATAEVFPRLTPRELPTGLFKAAVYETIGAIPLGRVATCEDISQSLGLSQADGALVRRIVERSPHPSLPWHRLISSDGSLPFRDNGLSDQQVELLRSEGIEVSEGRVDTQSYKWLPRQKQSFRGPITSGR